MTTQFGFGKSDITPRVGVDLSGFGPFLNRVAVGVRDRLWARAMAVSDGAQTAVLVACDLIGVTHEITTAVRRRLSQETGLPAEAVMISCSHTHSGPATSALNGWGRPDPPYLEILPDRIAAACTAALGDLSEATIAHACVPCEGIGLSREYDRDAPPLEEVLREDWRPAKPEVTDTRCHVFRVESGGRLRGFLSSFGCHPVVCCADTHWIHGDYCGVATNLIEREHPGSVGLFLQGAQGDVNSCAVHKPEAEALLALDVIAARYARAVRSGLREATVFDPVPLVFRLRPTTFTRERLDRATLQQMLAEAEGVLHAPAASDSDRGVRMAMVKAMALRSLLQRMDSGQALDARSEVQGLRLGPVEFLGAPFEIFQAIARRVVSEASLPTPIVLGLVNDLLGYAPDWERGGGGTGYGTGYAARTVPLILGELPYARVADELTAALLDLDHSLNAWPGSDA